MVGDLSKKMNPNSIACTTDIRTISGHSFNKDSQE